KRTTYTIFHFHRHIPRKATIPTTAANQLNGSFWGSRICIPNQTARFITTPTTAAVIAESAVVRWTLPRSCSMCGPPRKTQRKHGTNVVHVLMKAPSVAAVSGGRPFGTFHPRQRVASSTARHHNVSQITQTLMAPTSDGFVCAGDSTSSPRTVSASFLPDLF